MKRRDVRYWHKADIAELHRKCPLSGVKRPLCGAITRPTQR